MNTKQSIKYLRRISHEEALSTSAVHRGPPEPAADKGLDALAPFNIVDFAPEKAVATLAEADPNPKGRNIDDEFAELAKQWHDATDPLSVESEIIDHPAYWRIVAKGKSVVPCILRDLEANGGLWYRALEAIEGFTPVPEEKKNDLKELKKAWLTWGRDQQLIN